MKKRYFEILSEIEELEGMINSEGLPDYEAEELFEQMNDLNKELTTITDLKR